MGQLTRVFEFDSAHRVMNERLKCFNLHGHRFKVELTFKYEETSALGYAIDFKEIKRVCGEYLDSRFDHAVILNPQDKDLICFVQESKWRLYVMGLGNSMLDCNPSAENLAHEICYAVSRMFTMDKQGVELVNVRLYETPSCWVDCNRLFDPCPYSPTEDWLEEFQSWRESMGDVEYDVREI